MRPTRIEIAGLKGAAPVAYDLTSPLVFVTGANGQGKSRIREALDFVLGRDVAGVSGAGRELRAAVAGDALDVTLSLTMEDCAVQVRRVRRVDGGVFKRPVVYIAGVEADDTKLAELLGDVSAPSGSAWLELSEDKLTAELSRIGGGAGSSDALASRREAAKASVNEAQRALRAIEGSTDRSREVSVAAEIRPDEVALVEAHVAEAEAAFRAAENERVTAENAMASAGRALADWRAAKWRLDARAASAAMRLDELPAPAEAQAHNVDTDALLAARDAAVTYADGVAIERDAAAQAECSALLARGQTENATRGALTAIALLDNGRCPTCRQTVTVDVRTFFNRMVTEARATEAAAKAALDAASAYLQDQREEMERAAEDVAKATTACMAAAARATYDAARRTRNEAQAELAEFMARPSPQEPADAQARIAAAVEESEAKGRVLENLRARLTEASGQVERYKRWRSDLKARTEAEARKKAADALMESVRTAERDLATAGADRLLSTAAMYMPPEFGEPMIIEGAIGIRKDGVFWGGPGLSNAQRLVLALSIDRALDAINGRRLRLVMVEAEALDDATLDHVAAALEGDVEMGALDCAMLISCHEPPRLVPQWQRIHVGPPSPVRPGEPEDRMVAMRMKYGDLAVSGNEARPLTPPANIEASGVDWTGRWGSAPTPSSVIERVVANHDAGMPLVPPKGVADWLWRPGSTLGAKPLTETVNVAIDGLSASAVNAMRDWPGSERVPSACPAMDNDIYEELLAALLVDRSYPPRLTPAGVKAWELLHDVAPVQSDAQAERNAGAALAALDGAGVTEAEARDAIKGMRADALKSLGFHVTSVAFDANMTIGKRRDEIAARLARAGTLPAALADLVAKYNATFPPTPKRLTKGAPSGDPPTDETNDAEAVVALEGE